MRKPAALTILFGFILIATLSFATGQAGDVLILDGKKYSIFTNPLESWVEKNPNRIPRSNVTSTALWRGYIGGWPNLSEPHLSGCPVLSFSWKGPAYHQRSHQMCQFCFSVGCPEVRNPE